MESFNPKKRYAVFGSPVGHSISPFIFEQLFEKNNYNASYTRISTNNSKGVKYFFEQFALSGGNITAPLKRKCIKICEEATEDVKSIGAINTISNFQGRIFGFSTDWYGVLLSIMNKYDNKFSNALIVGAGGGASAVAYCLSKFFPNVKVTITNRTASNSRKLSTKFDLEVRNLDEMLNLDFFKYDIVFVTIPEPMQFFEEKNLFVRNL